MTTKPITAFPSELFEKLHYYVYRLIDPRDGSTFYVGKGKDNRIFNHLENAREGQISAEAELSDKIKKIRSILNDGLEPIHIIHRHGMTEDEAFEVEAALIDIFPGLDNEQAGHGSQDFGPANVSQLINRYACEEMKFEPGDNLLLIKINKTSEDRGIYEAVRHAWKIDINKAGKVKYVLAIDGGICKGVFCPQKWMPATIENFPSRTESLPERCGFIKGDEVPEDVKFRFYNKRLPEGSVKRGQSNPCAYIRL